MGQRYGELAQVFRTGETFEYTAPATLHESVINGNTDADAMQRTMYMKQIAARGKAITKHHEHSTVLGVHEDTCKLLINDPLWAEVERKQDHSSNPTDEHEG